MIETTVVPDFVRNVFSTYGSIEILQGGYNSDVFLVKGGTQEDIVIKYVGGKKGIKLSQRSALELGSQVERYRKMLIEKNVPVPGFLEWSVNVDEQGQVYLFLFEPYCGPNPHEILKQGARQAAVESMLWAIEPMICNQTELWVGIDPKSNNFVLDTNGQVTYVDFMPPRYRTDEGTYLVEYPNLTVPEQLGAWVWKYFSPEGILTLGLSQLGRVVPQYFGEIREAVIGWLKKRGALALVDYLNSQLMGLSSRKIEDTDNIYLLRLMACQLAHRADDHGFVEQFFLSTHYEGQPTAETIAHAKSALVQLCD